MALTRKALAAMGIESDKIDQIIEMHTETTNALKEERDSLKEKVEDKESKMAAVQKELDEAKEAMKNGDKSPYKVKYEAAVEEKEALQKEFDNYKADLANKEAHSKKEKAYREILKDAGIAEKHYAKILKYSDVDSLELDDDGKVKDSKKYLDSIKEEWGDHIASTSTKGADTETPPANNGGSSEQPSRAALMAQKYHEERYGKTE